MEGGDVNRGRLREGDEEDGRRDEAEEELEQRRPRQKVADVVVLREGGREKSRNRRMRYHSRVP